MTAPLGVPELGKEPSDAESIREAYEASMPDIDVDVELDASAIVAELEAETDAPPMGFVNRPARDTLRDLGAEPDWPAMYHHLGEPDSMHVTGVYLVCTTPASTGSPDMHHRFVATVEAQYERLDRKVVPSRSMAADAVDAAWPEAEFRDAHTESGLVLVSVRIHVPFDKRHLDWLDPESVDTVDDPSDPRFGLPETHTGEFTVGVLPQHAKDDIREAVSVERVEGRVEPPPGAWGGRVTLDTVEFYLGGIDKECIVDRVAIGERTGGPAGFAGSKLVTYATAEIPERDAASLDTIEVSDIEVTIT